jgi:Na+/phosphate symporter
VERHSEAISRLGHAIADFATQVRMEDLEREQAEHLPRLLRIARYLEEGALLIPQTAVVRRDLNRVADTQARDAIHSLLEATIRFLEVLDEGVRGEAGALGLVDRALIEFESIYQAAKSGLLRSAAARHLSIEQVDHHLDALSRLRRMVEQLAKAARMLGDEIFLRQESDRPEAT